MTKLLLHTLIIAAAVASTVLRFAARNMAILNPLHGSVNPMIETNNKERNFSRSGLALARDTIAVNGDTGAATINGNHV